jgi:hypothetical protein
VMPVLPAYGASELSLLAKLAVYTSLLHESYTHTARDHPLRKHPQRRKAGHAGHTAGMSKSEGSFRS